MEFVAKSPNQWFAVDRQKYDAVVKERDELKRLEIRPEYVENLELDVLGLTVTNKELMKELETREKITEVRFLGFRLYRRESR